VAAKVPEIFYGAPTDLCYESCALLPEIWGHIPPPA